MGISTRTAQVYTQCAKAQNSAHSDDLSLNQFLQIIRHAKRAARAEERREAREAAMQSLRLDTDHRVHHADCRRFRWPVVDAIATDPPWEDRSAYRWLARFASRKLREGGVAFVQCGQPDLADTLAILSEHLSYVWTLGIVFDRPVPSHTPFAISWRPIVVMSRGQWDRSGLRTVCDAITMSWSHYVKTHGDHQQPLRPWAYWLEAFTRPGELIADPFSGTGTTGVACKMTGRRFVGTEINEETARIAQGRINECKKEAPPG
jgi:hypothetical protein